MSIVIEQLSYIYGLGTPFAAKALEDCSLEVQEGEFLGLVGHTGSGKSTLVQHMNGLLKPHSGRVVVDGQDLSKLKALRDVRRKVGLVFQYPEHQLFEETVERDVGFGPRSLGLTDDDVRERVRRALEMVGLDYHAVASRSPFELSGGQRRRVAIAGVLAMEPKYVVLDEPTASLDPRGRRDMLDHIERLHREEGVAVVLVSHDMNEVARLADRVIVMDRGRIVMDGTPADVFDDVDRLTAMGLDVPETVRLMHRLRQSGFDVPGGVLSVDECASLIRSLLAPGEAGGDAGEV
ncbi:MAG: energy-coupling factor transporter ATPase [Firmicutes bacterium]|nr:energy-coupling factor transporter ATPase [Bacillota bacterium]